MNRECGTRHIEYLCFQQSISKLVIFAMSGMLLINCVFYSYLNGDVCFLLPFHATFTVTSQPYDATKPK